MPTTFAKWSVLSNSPQNVINNNHRCGVWAQAVHCQNGQTLAFWTWCDSTGLTGKPLREHSGWVNEYLHKTYCTPPELENIRRNTKKTPKWINLETWQMNNDKDYPSGNYLLLLSCLLFSFSKANWPIRTTCTIEHGVIKWIIGDGKDSKEKTNSVFL